MYQHLVTRKTPESISVSDGQGADSLLSAGGVGVPVADTTIRWQGFYLTDHGFPGQSGAKFGGQPAVGRGVQPI